jgi:hypothetical protein
MYKMIPSIGSLKSGEKSSLKRNFVFMLWLTDLLDQKEDADWPALRASNHPKTSCSDRSILFVVVVRAHRPDHTFWQPSTLR